MSSVLENLWDLVDQHELYVAKKLETVFYLLGSSGMREIELYLSGENFTLILHGSGIFLYESKATGLTVTKRKDLVQAIRDAKMSVNPNQKERMARTLEGYFNI